jgi:hypothetical protein
LTCDGISLALDAAFSFMFFRSSGRL